MAETESVANSVRTLSVIADAARAVVPGGTARATPALELPAPLVAADVVYQPMKNREIFSEGRGRSLNISSGGILFESETVLPVGASAAPI